MKFVVDAPLPPTLAEWIRAKGHEAFAVRELGLRDSEDDAIWAWAARERYIIVTKDRDFANLVGKRRTGSTLGTDRQYDQSHIVRPI